MCTGREVIAITSSDDVVDGGVLDSVVYDISGNEREPWPLFGRKIPRSEVLFFSQIALVLFIDIFCIVRLSLTKSCEERALYFTLLSSSLTYFMPSPERAKPLSNARSDIRERRLIGQDARFFLTITVILVVVIYCLAKLWIVQIKCQESTVYYMILSSILTYLIPAPQTGFQNE